MSICALRSTLCVPNIEQGTDKPFDVTVDGDASNEFAAYSTKKLISEYFKRMFFLPHEHVKKKDDMNKNRSLE